MSIPVRSSMVFMAMPWCLVSLAAAHAAGVCPSEGTPRQFKGESGESVVLCQKTGSAEEPDLFLDPACSRSSKGCEALELRKVSFKRRDELHRRIAKGEFQRGRNPLHMLCTEGGGKLVYLAIVETGSQLVACRLKDGSLIAVDSLGTL